jgi:ketosteroid isomerase-like protein
MEEPQISQIPQIHDLVLEGFLPMNALRAARSLAGLLGLAVACSAPPPPFSDAHAAAIQDSVRSMLAEFRAHSAAGQWDSMARMYADDPRFRWFEDGVIRYRSAAEVRQALAGLLAGMRIETTYDSMEIVAVAPGIATASTLFETRFTDSTGGGFGFGGAITMTLVHEADGWRFLGGHSSSPKPRGP